MNKIRVFLTDDQPIVRRGLALLLREEGDIEVVGEAADGRESIEGVQELTPDVVLMDIGMPGMSGLEATSQIVDAVPGVSVLILTVHDREDFLFEALQAGALGYVLKTARVDELLAAIRTVHAGDVFVYPRMATKLVGRVPQAHRHQRRRRPLHQVERQRAGGVVSAGGESYQPRDSRLAPSKPLHGPDL